MAGSRGFRGTSLLGTSINTRRFGGLLERQRKVDLLSTHPGANKDEPCDEDQSPKRSFGLHESFVGSQLHAAVFIDGDQSFFHCLFQDSAEFDLLFENAFDQWVASTASEKCTFFQILHHTCQRYLPDRKPEFINCQSKIMGGEWALGWLCSSSLLRPTFT